MTGALNWPGPPRTKPAPWTGRRVRGPGKARGLNFRTWLGDQPIVEVGGEIDVQSAAELRDQLLRVMRRHSPCVALDLDDVTFMDWAGVEVLLATRRRAGLEGGWVHVVRASPCVRRMLILAGLERAFALPDSTATG
jgi:anti-sigma B factor antagonist